MRLRRKFTEARKSVCFAALAIVAGLTSFPSNAAAGEAESPSVIRIAFESDPDCTTATAFLASVQPRLSAQHLVVNEPGNPSESPAPVQVTIRRTENGAEANLVVELKSRETRRRRIEATSCAEALEAIAFITAVALDPDQGAEPLREDSAEPQEPASSNSPQPRFEVMPENGPSSPCWSVWARFGVLSGAAPSLLGGGGLGTKWGCDEPGLWSPSLSIGGTFFMSPLISEDDGSAFVYLFSAPVDLCPSRWGGDRFALIPCMTMTGGALLGQGVNTLEPESHLRPWLSVGGSLSLELVVHSRLALVARGSLEAPLLRYSFQFGDEAFYSVGGVAGRGTFGVLLKL